MIAMYTNRRSGKISVHRPTYSNVTLALTLGTITALTFVGFFFLDTKDVDFFKALGKTFIDLKTMFVDPIINIFTKKATYHFTILEAMYQVLITLALAFLTTLIGAVIAFFMSLLAARNIGNARISNIIKGFVALVRAIPTVLWVLIFAIGAGLGSVAAVIGMTFHSLAYLVKAYSESFEEIDSGVIEALKAGGASWWQIVFQAILPSSVSYLLSWTFIRFEINFTTAVAMGAAAGAGGIGFDLFMASSFYFNLKEVGVITYLILAVAILLEILATRIKATQRIII